MRKWSSIILIGALLATVGTATPARALGIFAQWQDSKDADSGFGFGVARSIPVVPLFRVEGRISYLGYDKSLHLFPVEAVGKVSFDKVYGGVGLGYYFITGSGSPDNDIGGSLLAGVDFTLFGLGAFGEVRYLVLKPELSGAEVDMNGFGATLGVLLPI